MKFQFKCRICGKCCKHYKIIINLVDALQIFHHTRQRFYDTFKLIDINEMQVGENYIYNFFKIKNKEYLLSIINNYYDGCVFLKDKKCVIQEIKPSVCYFYPIKYDNDLKKFVIEKYDICSGDYDDEFTEWQNLEEKYAYYSENCNWHNDIVNYWNEHYSQAADEKDFVIFFYEVLYPLYLDGLKS